MAVEEIGGDLSGLGLRSRGQVRHDGGQRTALPTSPLTYLTGRVIEPDVGRASTQLRAGVCDELDTATDVFRFATTLADGASGRVNQGLIHT